MNNVLTESGLELDSSKTKILKKKDDSSCLCVVKGVPCTVLDEKTANGRIYTYEEMKKAINYLRETNAFESRRLICSASDHPENSLVPKPITASHVVIDAYIKEENGKRILYNDWLILPTFNGQQLLKLMEAKVTLGTSIRGTGVLTENGVVKNYSFYGTDVVGLPSANTYFRLQESVSLTKARREDREMKKNVSESIVKMTQEIALLREKLREKTKELNILKKKRLPLEESSSLSESRKIAVLKSILEGLKRPNYVSYSSPVKNSKENT